MGVPPIAGWFLLGKIPSVHGWWLGVPAEQCSGDQVLGLALLLSNSEANEGGGRAVANCEGNGGFLFGLQWFGDFLKWGYPQSSSMYRLGLSRSQKPSSYWGTPIYENPHLVLSEIFPILSAIVFRNHGEDLQRSAVWCWTSVPSDLADISPAPDMARMFLDAMFRRWDLAEWKQPDKRG